MDFILNYDTRLRPGFGGNDKYRLGRDPDTEGDGAQPLRKFRADTLPGSVNFLP